MFRPRRIESRDTWADADGVKLYTVSASGAPVDRDVYLRQLVQLKAARAVDWAATPAFAIFHDGSNAQYLVLAWWGNENELFTVVTVRLDAGWTEQPERYSFCLWDLEIFWAERNFFIDHIYCDSPDIGAYRRARIATDQTVHSAPESERKRE